MTCKFLTVIPKDWALIKAQSAMEVEENFCLKDRNVFKEVYALARS